MLRGFATISFWAEDVNAARAWYGDLFGMEPYFQRPDAEHPAYIEFRIGDYEDEFGIIDARYAPHNAASCRGGAIMYWHVDDVNATLEHLLAAGATLFEPVTQRGEGWYTASVLDPFGNILGIMVNPHYVKTLHELGKA